MTSQPARDLMVSCYRRLGFVAGALPIFALVGIACLPQSTAYPIEIFAEMHYSQAHKSQEPPRLPPLSEAVAFTPLGDLETPGHIKEMLIPERQERKYSPEMASELYRVNCAVCHGSAGLGDGPAAQHISNSFSYYATETGQAYAKPTNLQTTRINKSEEVVFSIISNGIFVMPKWRSLLSEEERWDLVQYIFDEQTGLASNPP